VVVKTMRHRRAAAVFGSLASRKNKIVHFYEGSLPKIKNVGLRAIPWREACSFKLNIKEFRISGGEWPSRDQAVLCLKRFAARRPTPSN